MSAIPSRSLVLIAIVIIGMYKILKFSMAYVELGYVPMLESYGMPPRHEHDFRAGRVGQALTIQIYYIMKHPNMGVHRLELPALYERTPGTFEICLSSRKYHG